MLAQAGKKAYILKHVLALDQLIEEGFYYDIDLGEEKFTDDMLIGIEKKMGEFAKQGFEIKGRSVSYTEAKIYFRK